MLMDSKNKYAGEVHITLGRYFDSKQAYEEYQVISDLAKNFGLKVLLIRNDTNPTEYQVMTATKFIPEVMDFVIDTIKYQEEHFIKNGYKPIRTKVELRPDPAVIYRYPEGYWEIHVDFSMDRLSIKYDDLNDLNKFLHDNDIHTSVNMDKFIDFESYTRNYIATVREHRRMSYESAAKIAKIIADRIETLTGFPTKTILEYCIYDTNKELDNYWMKQR